MKEFIKSQKITYNLMSFTAFKSLLMFTILVESPKSFDEIISIIENHPYLREKVSIDTVRVYLNSLKRIGCEIKRVRGADKVSRYYITSHPFELNLSDAELSSVVKVFKTLAKSMDVKDLLFMDNLFEKIGSYIKNQDFVNTMRKISMLKGVNKELLTEFIEYCDKNLKVTISYKSPNSGLKDIDVIAENLEVKNGKIYLCGFGLEYNEHGIFLFDRIKQIKNVAKPENVPNDIKKISVVYQVDIPSRKVELEPNETLLKKRGNKFTIAITSSNRFLLKQKFLELADTCQVLEPEDFREDFINTLKDMKAGYYCEE